MTQAAATQLLELPLLAPLLLLLLQLLQHNNNWEVRSSSLFFSLVKRNLKMAKKKCVCFLGFLVATIFYSFFFLEVLSDFLYLGSKHVAKK
jgi:hypothetical protein